MAVRCWSERTRGSPLLHSHVIVPSLLCVGIRRAEGDLRNLPTAELAGFLE